MRTILSSGLAVESPWLTMGQTKSGVVESESKISSTQNFVVLAAAAKIFRKRKCGCKKKEQQHPEPDLCP